MNLPPPNLPPQHRPAYRAAQAICRHHAKSFYFSSFFLPKTKRLRAYAVYAFCRGIDDAVDTGNASEVDQRYNAFARSLDSIYEGQLVTDGLPEDQALALHAFADTVHTCSIPKQYFLDLAHGVRMDLTVHRYATWPELDTYCYHVAGVVGLIMCKVFNLQNAQAEAQAVTMGAAMQLTNILRDIAEDWKLGRLYLPQEDLERFKVTEQQIASGLFNDNLKSLMRFEIDRARRLYAEGAQGLQHLPNDGSRLTACAMAVIYAGILQAIEKQNLNPFAGRARLNLPQKLARIPAARILANRIATHPIPSVF